VREERRRRRRRRRRRSSLTDERGVDERGQGGG